MTSTASNSASPLIQLFHNQLFDDLEAHRLKNLDQEGQAVEDIQGENLDPATNGLTTQAHLLFPYNQ